MLKLNLSNKLWTHRDIPTWDLYVKRLTQHRELETAFSQQQEKSCQTDYQHFHPVFVMRKPSASSNTSGEADKM